MIGLGKTKATDHSPLASVGRYFFLCVSLPKAKIGCITRELHAHGGAVAGIDPLYFARDEAVAARGSSPAPPYSSGIVGAEIHRTHPA